MPGEQIFLETKPALDNSDANGNNTKKRIGIITTGIIGGSLVALYAVAAPFVTPALRKVCLPFVPATTTQVENVFKVLGARTGTLVDIGSGDGRIVIAAAKHGFQASGFELNPWLVWYSRYKAWREGVHHSTSFHISDLWKMDQLEEKLGNELQSTAKVVACRFPFPTWVPDQTAGEGIDTVWVYDAKTFKSQQQGGTTKTLTEQEHKPISTTWTQTSSTGSHHLVNINRKPDLVD
ncbi:ATP synthase subunit C lysine N-methyltransferase isoform X2 [Lampris incognitus]|uniref:ATP synthase subunit C lysine N-methyltransferase isoform X2 n=1 Tax=Lampris incognitus TaxID=2546036 RepID=UPI0024B5F49A|nr:ATP synthase subunit C lysine N-methyltransferase isoform X2 [Lampris incognitus]